jgi:arabinan endo-1,5-alpha-L-arabinosidase
MMSTPLNKFTNPVFPSNVPDPFVFKYAGSYWCYSTGWASDGMCFPVLASDDLVHWKEQGGAMIPLDQGHSEYWAPEVNFWDGRFYLYYSVGDGSSMEIRAAISESVVGPFRDCGVRLTSQDFAIDPHVFNDNDGRRWLFYATDFLQHSHIGTGTVRDQLIDSMTLANQPRPVVLPCYDWQLFDPMRKEKGGVKWHTVEGPTVLKRKGVYYEMFSGGNWKNESYGVSYATSLTVDSEAEWKQASDGLHVLPVLRSVPGVTGPGHNSVVRGPDNRQLYCVYHRWSQDATRRMLAIDRLEFVGRDLTVFGPTSSPQDHPNFSHAGFFKHDWTARSGDWSAENGRIVQRSNHGYCEILYCGTLESDFLLECSVKASDWNFSGRVGIAIHDSSGTQTLLSISPTGELSLCNGVESEGSEKKTEPSYPISSAFHLLRFEVCGSILRLSRGMIRCQSLKLNGTVRTIGLFTHSTAAEFCAFNLTPGWQLDFDDDNDLHVGFHGDIGSWQVSSMELCHRGDFRQSKLFKHIPSGPYEFTVNARLGGRPGGFYGFFPAAPAAGNGPLIAVIRTGNSWRLVMDPNGDVSTGFSLAEFPESFDPLRYEQFSMIVNGLSVSVMWRGRFLTEATIETFGTRVGLCAFGEAFFEMIRVTQLTDDPTR